MARDSGFYRHPLGISLALGAYMKLFLLSVAAAVLCAAMALAQTNRGSITGTVTDASGAGIPGAQITATGSETGTTYSTVSTSS